MDWEHILNYVGLVPPEQTMRELEDLIAAIGEKQFCMEYLEVARRNDPEAFKGATWEDILRLRVRFRCTREAELGLEFPDENFLDPEEEYLCARICFSDLPECWCLVDDDFEEIALEDMVRVKDHSTGKVKVGRVVEIRNYPEGLLPCSPDMLDDIEDIMESLPLEKECFQAILDNMNYGLQKCSNLHPGQIPNDFLERLAENLERFGSGEDCEEYDISAGFTHKNSTEYVDIHIEEQMISVSQGGSVYDPSVGSDSFTDWMYSIWNNGQEDDKWHDVMRFNSIGSFLSDAAAEISIEGPDEFYFNSKNTEECTYKPNIKLTNCICYYSSDNRLYRWQPLNSTNIPNTLGMLVQCVMKNGDINTGFCDVYGSFDKNLYDGEMHDAIYLWTWRHLNEETHILTGEGESKYDQDIVRVEISDIVRMNAIMYSNPRWGTHLTNTFYVTIEENDWEQEGIREAITDYILSIDNPNRAALEIERVTDRQNLPLDFMEEVFDAYQEKHEVSIDEMCYYPNGDQVITPEAIESDI